MGDILIPRFTNLPLPTDLSHYQLGISDTLGSSSTSIRERSIACRVQEWGRGKDDAAPVKISTFLSAYSLLNLEQEMERVLGMDYLAFVDLQVRSLFATANYVVYANGNDLVMTPGEVVTDGTLNRYTLLAAHRAMQEEYAPPLPDGNYSNDGLS